MVELIKMVEKQNTLITLKYGTYFVFLKISFKVCNGACIVPSFDKKTHIHPFLLSVFKMNDTIVPSARWNLLPPVTLTRRAYTST